ncbi:cation transporter [bacterium]|nr:cation transporter [bacterium]
MSATCNDGCSSGEAHLSKTYRKILWICFLANALMFFVQAISSMAASSASLLANSADFLADAVNYGITLFVIAGSDASKRKASTIKGVSLAVTGLWAAFETLHHAVNQKIPEADIMGWVSLVALGVNVLCALLLYKYREGDINMRSVWICSRNDALGNIAVMIAAVGVFATVTVWPDVIVAAILAGLALHGAYQILNQSLRKN